jgi:hypothetical protein
MTLWSYIPLDQFKHPAEPAREAALGRLRRFVQLVRTGNLSAQPMSVQAELRSASLKLLDRVAPSPRWGATERALESAFAEWKEAEQPEQSVQVVIGPPGTGTSHVVRKWAERNGYRIVQPPPYREIIAGKDGWLGQLDGDDPLALPNLECFLLRHYNGFDAFRKLIDRLCSCSRRYVIGCNSWTWAFLSRSFHIGALLPQPLVISPFDSNKMEHWLHVLAGSITGGSLVFRLTDDGSNVLPDVESRAEQPAGERLDEADHEVPLDKRSGQFLQRLAARSRGNPLVGWAMWRQSLQIANDEDIEEEAQEAAAADRGRTIWVRPWSQLSFPEIPPGTDRHDLMVLHTLLLHDGLPADILDLLLPLSLGAIMERLYRLRAVGLIKIEDGLWRVTLLGYPAVRQAMADEDLIVDDF